MGFENLLPADSNRFTSITNEVTQCSWNKPASFFGGNPQYEFHPSVGFSGQTSKELLAECIAFFRSKGLDILVRDCSSLSFCTYQIIIPGYSECLLNRLDQKNCQQTNIQNLTKHLIAERKKLDFQAFSKTMQSLL